MNAPQLKISPFAFGPRPRRNLAALYAVAPLLIFACTARTPLHPLGASSPEDNEDASEPTGGAVATTAAGGGGVAGAPGRGGAGGTGGSIASAGAPGRGGAGGTGGSIASAGSRASGGVSGSSVGGTRNGGAPSTGGTRPIPSGGHSDGGSRSTVGGATTNTGGMMAGGAITTGNATAAGGSSHVGGSVATGGTPPVGTPAIQPDGFVTVDTGTVVMMGHVSSYESGSGSSITLTYGPNSFCASGTVAADSTYASWAGAGFNVNQAESGASGSSSSLVLSGSSISLTYANHAGSTLRLQLYDGSDYWCTTLPAATSPTTITIPFSQLNTQCWSGLGSQFVSGTPITAVQLMVPCSGFSPTPFDFCFLGLTVQ